MADDFVGHGFLLGGRVAFAVICIGAGGDEGAEAFIPGMGGDVDATAAEDVVVGDDYGRPAVGGVVIWRADVSEVVVLMMSHGDGFSLLRFSWRGAVPIAAAVRMREACGAARQITVKATAMIGRINGEK